MYIYVYYMSMYIDDFFSLRYCSVTEWNQKKNPSSSETNIFKHAKFDIGTLYMIKK